MSFRTAEIDRVFAALDAFVELGGNAVDTAHIYGPDTHKTIGHYLRERGRDSLILLDKGAHPYGRNRVTEEDIRSDLLENQERMEIEHTDFFVLHRDDPEIPVEHIVDWLNVYVREGRISAFGGSNWHHSRIAAGNAYALASGQQGFSISSSNLALATPIEPMWGGALSLDDEARAWYEESQFPLFSWSSGAGGFFAGVESDNVRRVYHNDANFAKRERAKEVGVAHGASATQIAVAWLLNQPLTVAAIIGARTDAEVRESLAVASLLLTPEESRYLEFGE
jgi:aryl-alcohol dehydrogenase-like predicted oxidoreductase